MSAHKVLADALKLVESRSIRQWVLTPKHYKVWLQFIEEGKVSSDPQKLSTTIVIEAIGL